MPALPASAAPTAGGGPNLDRLRVTGQSDSQAPAPPGAPVGGDVADTHLDLAGPASSDNVGVTAYDRAQDLGSLNGKVLRMRDNNGGAGNGADVVLRVTIT